MKANLITLEQTRASLDVGTVDSSDDEVRDGIDRDVIDEPLTDQGPISDNESSQAMAPIDPGADIVDPVRDIIDESLFDQGPSSSKNVGRTKPTRYLRKVAKGIKSQLHEALEPAQLVTTAKDRTKKAKRERAAEKTSGKAATKKRDRSEDVSTVLCPASNKPNASNRPSRSLKRA